MAVLQQTLEGLILSRRHSLITELKWAGHRNILEALLWKPSIERDRLRDWELLTRFGKIGDLKSHCTDKNPDYEQTFFHLTMTPANNLERALRARGSTPMEYFERGDRARLNELRKKDHEIACYSFVSPDSHLAF